ncbi:hypothetical protein BU17DRAFT_89609 [Hysterangium stoloniferum]|nr:hypothetical protein BU17DRAFT_89609 [Hysterangium stoloniferum]
MSQGSYNYYPPSSSRQGSHDRRLPPIRDVLGDELKRRTADPYALNDVRYALPSVIPSGSTSRRDSRGPTLPPFRHGDVSRGHNGAYTSSSGSRGGYPHADHASHQSRDVTYSSHAPRPIGTLRSSTPAPMPSSTLIQGTIPYGGNAIPAAYESEPEKRHRCEYCGKKFDRPSSLQVHVRTHTGLQPFACDWPGCTRTFNVKSNMLRHYRSHERSELSQHSHGYGSDDDEVVLEYPGKGSSFTSQATGQPSNTTYYSSMSSRR